MGKSIRILWGALAAVSAFGASAAEIKRWVDAEGRVHFGDQAPRAVESEALEIDAGSGSPSPAGLRPGELEMIENYEQRGLRLEDAKRRSARESERERYAAEEIRVRRARCDYYQARLDHHRNRKRRGYSRDEGDRIDAQIQLYEMKTKVYCD